MENDPCGARYTLNAQSMIVPSPSPSLLFLWLLGSELLPLVQVPESTVMKHTNLLWALGKSKFVSVSQAQ